MAVWAMGSMGYIQLTHNTYINVLNVDKDLQFE